MESWTTKYRKELEDRWVDCDKRLKEALDRLALIEEELEETESLCDRLAYLLRHTARALKGRELPLHGHDWADLPAVASKMRMENEEYHRRDMNRIGLRPKAKPRHKKPKEQPYLLKQLEIQWVESPYIQFFPHPEGYRGHDDKGRAPERPAPPEGPAEPGTD